MFGSLFVVQKTSELSKESQVGGNRAVGEDQVAEANLPHKTSKCNSAESNCVPLSFSAGQLL